MNTLRGNSNMATYGYHRTSTTDQHLDRGIAAIREYCEKSCMELDEMFTDKCTGKNFNRPDYMALKRIAKKYGDVIIVSELDRLGRNKEDVLKEFRHYMVFGVRLMIL
jgi:DNA invertase Pin-like site-specific DNA recombinase